MCGLFGHFLSPELFGQMGNENYAIMCTVLGMAMDERGRDSWGIARFEDNWEPRLDKGLGNIAESVKERFPKSRPVLLAHTRKMTTGAVTVENAHPFIVEGVRRVVGAHNGIISNHFDAKKEWSKDWAVDSQAIFHALADHKPLSFLKGWGAVSYATDDSPGKIYLSRFNNGQLTVLGIGKDPKSIKGLLWASTENAVKMAAKAAGFEEFFTYKFEEGLKYYVEESRLFVVPEEKFDISSTYSSSLGRANCGYNPHHRTHEVSVTRPKNQDDGEKRETNVGNSTTRDSSSKNELGIMARIPFEHVDITPSIIKSYAQRSSYCDWCNSEKWEMYLIKERVFLCLLHWNQYTGNEIEGGDMSYNQVLYQNTYTRYEVLDKPRPLDGN